MKLNITHTMKIPPRHAACCLLLLLAGCSRSSTPDGEAISPRPSDAPIARVGDVTISRAAFDQEWKRRADARSKNEVLQEMIQFESLLARARATGADRDPELVTAFQRMVVGRFQEEQLNRRGLDSVQVSEAEIETFFQEHPDRFTTPKQVRLGLIQRKASPKADPARRAQLHQETESLWTQAKQTGEDGFRQLAMKYSDDQATRYAGGDTGWFVPEQTDSRWEPKIVEAVSSLSAPGELAPLVETGSGFHIVKLLGTQQARLRPLSEVRDGIEYQLRLEKAQVLRQQFFQEMRAGLAIEVNQAALDAIPDRALQASTRQPPSLPR